MNRIVLLSTALVLAVPATAQVTDPLAPAADPAPPSDGNGDVREKVRDCAGEKFTFAWGAGASPTKVTLCSEPGASPEKVVEMIESAAAKVEATTTIAEDRRIAIVQQMKAKIAEIQGVAAKPGGAPKSTLPTYTQVIAQSGKAGPAPVRVLPVGPPPAKPNLKFQCITPGEFAGGGPCITMTRDTLLLVKAGEPIAAGASLRFVRRGESRAEIDLGTLRKGQTVRLLVPREICGGIVTGEVEMHVIRSGHVADRQGPYLLRC